MQAHSLRLTLAGAQDEAFLRGLYVCTRAGEVQAWGWDEAQAQAFLAQQFMAQQLGYHHQFGAEHDQIVHLDGAAIGRLFVAPTGEALCVVDIALLPAHRGHGIGTQLLRQVLRTAAEQRKSVRLSVLRNNPAQHLYTRLGFTLVAQDDPHLELAWAAPPLSTGICHATN